LNFSYRDDQLLVRDTVRDFVRSRIVPNARAWSDKGEFPLELVPELRASPSTQGCRILVLSASVLPDDRAAAELAGVDGFMAKPLRIAALLEEIRRQLAS